MVKLRQTSCQRHWLQPGPRPQHPTSNAIFSPSRSQSSHRTSHCAPREFSSRLRFSSALSCTGSRQGGGALLSCVLAGHHPPPTPTHKCAAPVPSSLTAGLQPLLLHPAGCSNSHLRHVTGGAPPRAHLRHGLGHRGSVQLQGAAPAPALVVALKLQLHEVARHRRKQHVALLGADGVAKLPDAVVGGAAARAGRIAHHAVHETAGSPLGSARAPSAWRAGEQAPECARRCCWCAAAHQPRRCRAAPFDRILETSFATLGFSATFSTLMGAMPSVPGARARPQVQFRSLDCRPRRPLRLRTFSNACCYMQRILHRVFG